MALGCYTDPYLSPSFKGVSFEAMDTSSKHGRRGAEGEFPFGEDTAYADMGRRIRMYAIKARFAGNDHVTAAGLLIAACESRGPGILIHPTRGAIRVGCKSCDVSDNPLEEQGVTYVDMEFVEANEWVTGFSLTTSIFGFDVSSLITVATGILDANYIVNNAYIFRQAAVKAVASSAITFVRDLFAEATASNQDDNVWLALTQLDFEASSNATLLSTAKTMTALFDTLAAIDSVSSGLTKIEYMRRVANFAATPTTLTGSAAIAVNGIYSSLRVGAAAYIIRGALESTPETLTQAFDQYDIVAILLEDEASNALLLDDTYSHVKILESLTEAQKSLLNRAYNLPALVSYNFHSAVSSIFAAYEIYGDPQKHVEIEIRNPTQLPWNMGPVIVAVNPNA